MNITQSGEVAVLVVLVVNFGVMLNVALDNVLKMNTPGYTACFFIITSVFRAEVNAF